MGAWGSAHAQVVDIPDPNLRAAIQQELNLPPNAAITRDDMRRLVAVRYNAFRQLDITDLRGMEFATELRTLEIPGGGITDVSPLVNLTQLTKLNLAWNGIADITPLANLTQLTYLDLSGNQITDPTPIASLTRLEYLEIQQNRIFDHSPLDDLALTHFEYDEDYQICDMPQLPLRERLDNRNLPSVYMAWGKVGTSPVLNQPHLSEFDQIAQHDLYWDHLMHGGDYVDVGDEVVIGGMLDDMIQRRDVWIAANPNMIFLVELRAVWDDLWRYPSDSEYWLRDEHGQRERVWDVLGFLDLGNAAYQKRLIDLVAGLSQCGLYDGIFIDGWAESDFARRGILDGAETILKGIRERVDDDFLILVNTNKSTAATAAPYINGLFLESGVPRDFDDPADGFRLLEDRLSWAEANLREPRINAPQGQAYVDEPLDSPTNLQWMRALTALTLTFTDGYVLIKRDTWEGVHRHWHYWYDFWDADLGQPVGEKSNLHDDAVPGLYIREFTNGWAVYNNSGSAQVVELPEKARSVTSGLEIARHAVLNPDGDIFLRIEVTLPGDINGDGSINIIDLVIVAQALGTDDESADVNGDGVINILDLVVVANQF